MRRGEETGELSSWGAEQLALATSRDGVVVPVLHGILPHLHKVLEVGDEEELVSRLVGLQGSEREVVEVVAWLIKR